MPVTTSGQIDKYGIPGYQDYRGGNSYAVDTGVLVLPTCDGGGPVVIQTHDAYRTRQVSYGGVGQGRPTVVPRPADTDTVIGFVHDQHLPVPFQVGNNRFLYPCAGGYTVLEGLASSYSTAVYECPRYPVRLEPMATEMEAAGFSYVPDPDVTPPASRLEDPYYVWPQALTITSDFFSDLL